MHARPRVECMLGNHFRSGCEASRRASRGGLECMLPRCSPRAETSRAAVISHVASAWATSHITGSARAPHVLSLLLSLREPLSEAPPTVGDWRHGDVVLPRREGDELSCRRASCRFCE